MLSIEEEAIIVAFRRHTLLPLDDCLYALQAAINAILYLLRTGCPWRYLPHDSFPPRSTVYNIFRKFQRDGVWEAIWAELHMALRERMGREASPSAAVLDSQSIKSTEKGAAETTRRVTTPARR